MDTPVWTRLGGKDTKTLIASAVWMFKAAVSMTVPLFTTNTEHLHVLISVLFIQFNSDKRLIQRAILFFTAKVDFKSENNFVFGKIYF
jgi:hypothetical protein